MRTKEILKGITGELQQTFDELDQDQLNELRRYILGAKKIFVAGAGRSLLMIRGLAMRLMHMGFTSYVVGETVTPAIEEGDLLIIASGSGATATLRAVAEKCSKIRANLALLTTAPDSPIAMLADCVVKVPAATTKRADSTRTTIQPGANTFEQSVLLIGDALIMELMESRTLSDNNERLMKRHANLE